MRYLFFLVIVGVVVISCSDEPLSVNEDKCEWTSDEEYFPLQTGNVWEYKYTETILRPEISENGDWSRGGRPDDSLVGTHRYTIVSETIGGGFLCRLDASDSIYLKDSLENLVYTKDTVYSDSFEIKILNCHIQPADLFNQNNTYSLDYFFTNTPYSISYPIKSAMVLHEDTSYCVC